MRGSTVVAVGILTLHLAAPATPGQVTRPGPADGARRPDGGFTPFRYRAFGGAEFEAAALTQPECPLQLAVTRVAREASGVVLSLQLANIADTSTPRQVVGAWVIAPDGTVRGYQRLEARRAIAAGGTRSVDLTLRQAIVQVMPNDVVVVAVEEATGTSPWRRDRQSLEVDARAVVQR